MESRVMSKKFGYAVVDYEGIPYPPFLNTKAIDDLRENFIPRNDDIFIATYPKCGTTWTQHIVALLLSNGKVSGAPSNTWLEAGASSKLLDSRALMKNHQHGRRAFKTHAPYHLLPCKKLPNETKIIYVTRNPKDCAVSLYHHASRIAMFHYSGDFHHFLTSLYCDGKVESGSWFDHTIGWVNAAKEKPEQILVVTFEDLKRKPKDTIIQIAKFIHVEASDDLINLIVEKTSFTEMKAQNEKDGGHLPNGHFRKGDIGDWKNYFTSDENKQFDQLYEEKMKPIADALQLVFE